MRMHRLRRRREGEVTPVGDKGRVGASLEDGPVIQARTHTLTTSPMEILTVLTPHIAISHGHLAQF